jgi:hypothetical protein
MASCLVIGEILPSHVCSLAIRFRKYTFLFTGFQVSLYYVLVRFSNLSVVLRPAPVAARSKTRMVLARSNTGIVGWNPFRGTDACPGFPV